MTGRITLIATTAFGLEAVVKRELSTLGYEASVVSPGWVQFDGDGAAICRANLWLRSADRILLRVAHFPCSDFEVLFETTRSADWGRWLPGDAEFPVVGRSIKSQLSSVPACQRAVKRAVVESLKRGHSANVLPETGPLYKIQIALINDQATLTLDTTGPSLHKRGYRKQAGPAPIKETLAAALVQLSFWQPDRPLWDPFCGSGTIPIEAALIGRNFAPGLTRTFACEEWPVVPKTCWEEARTEARDLVRPPFEERLIGTDEDARALAAARNNAEAAGVADQLHFQQQTFEGLSSKRKYGCVITNPPYGERIGEARQLDRLYESIPEVLRHLPTWSHFILTSFPQFERLIGKKADRRRKLYNGRIECTYYQFHGPRPVANGQDAHCDDESTPTPESASNKAGNPTAVFGELTSKADEQAEIFANRLRKVARHLRRWPKRGVTCYRLYERDVPEIPLVVDRYEDHLHINEYERPHDRDLAQHANWLDLMVQTAASALEIDVQKVFLKRRRRQRGSMQHEQISDQHYEITVSEGGLRFIVNLSDYVDTGLFLDHRITRSLVREVCKGKNVLNLFGYTGAFSVYAAAGGARRTATVDWTRSYLEWARRNMALNGFDGAEHSFIRDDARGFLSGNRERFDVAVVDPPTFSNSKRTDEDWSVQDGYIDLLNGVRRHMTPGGLIFFSTNFRRFKFDGTLIHATQIREISKQTVPDDFRNRRIHRCWRMVV